MRTLLPGHVVDEPAKGTLDCISLSMEQRRVHQALQSCTSQVQELMHRAMQLTRLACGNFHTRLIMGSKQNLCRYGAEAHALHDMHCAAVSVLLVSF